MNGFGAVPEELRSTGGKIGELVGTLTGVPWQRPSGEYGHEGVQAGFGAFIEDMKSHVDGLRKTADGHGVGLGDAAKDYDNAEAEGSGALGKAGKLLDGLVAGPLGGSGGGVFNDSHIGGPGLMGASSGIGAQRDPGFVRPDVASRLNPDGTNKGARS